MGGMEPYWVVYKRTGRKRPQQTPSINTHRYNNTNVIAGINTRGANRSNLQHLLQAPFTQSILWRQKGCAALPPGHFQQQHKLHSKKKDFPLMHCTLKKFSWGLPPSDLTVAMWNYKSRFLCSHSSTNPSLLQEATSGWLEGSKPIPLQPGAS